MRYAAVYCALNDLKDNFLMLDTDDYFGYKLPGLRRVRKCSGGTARMLWHAQGVWMAPSLRHPAGPPSGQARGAVHGVHEFRQEAGLHGVTYPRPGRPSRWAISCSTTPRTISCCTTRTTASVTRHLVCAVYISAPGATRAYFGMRRVSGWLRA